MHLLNHVIELGPRQHLQCISIDVEYPVALDLCVATLHQALVTVVLSLWILGVGPILLCVESLSLALPFFLDDLNDCVLLRLPLGCGVAGLASGHGILWDQAELLLREAVLSDGLCRGLCASFWLLVSCTCADDRLWYS